jgi:hypothetical protein
MLQQSRQPRGWCQRAWRFPCPPRSWLQRRPEILEVALVGLHLRQPQARAMLLPAYRQQTASKSPLPSVQKVALRAWRSPACQEWQVPGAPKQLQVLPQKQRAWPRQVQTHQAQRRHASHCPLPLVAVFPVLLRNCETVSSGKPLQQQEPATKKRWQERSSSAARHWQLLLLCAGFWDYCYCCCCCHGSWHCLAQDLS